MNLPLDSSSTESHVFHVEQSSEEGSLIRNNTPAILNSTEISGAMEREVITIASFASPEPRIVTLDSDSNDPTTPYGFGSQQPIGPPSPNDLNLSPNHQCAGDYGRNSSGWCIQPPVTRALHPVSNFNASNECQYHWRLGHNVYHNWRCHLLHWCWA